jgi:SAM-dependent methyltransferase
MDELAAYNRERWNALVSAGIEYSRAWLDLTPPEAVARLNGNTVAVLDENSVRGKRVLCLANGGGQQSAAFAMLGADVTVIDLADAQLAQDRVAAAHYGFQVRIEQGDMRDLSRFEADAFDVVWQGYSINFVPNPRQVFAQVARVLRGGGNYMLQFSNPHRDGLKDENWRGPEGGYALVHPYRDGEFQFEDKDWEVWRADGSCVRVPGPREFNHTLSTMVNGLAEQGFAVLRLQEWVRREPNPEAGSWAHCTQVLPPFLAVWTVLGRRDEESGKG